MRGTAQRANRGWVGVPTFLRSDYCPDPSDIDADIAVFGVPFDEGSPLAGGSRFAPRSLREHSLRFGGTDGFYDLERDRTYLARELRERRIVDLGDVDILPTNVEGSLANVTSLVRQILEQSVFPVALGGDHTISYPVVRAFAGPLHVVQFDAHLDYAAPNLGMYYTNGQPFRLIHQLEQVTGLTQVGIRSLRNSKGAYDAARSAGSQIVTTNELHRLGPNGLAAVVPRGVSCYVSIDVDALDISLTPGCVSAEPNGMTYDELRDCFAALAERNEVVGFDFVEVNPLLDVGTGVTSYLGAHLVIEFLGILCEQPWWRARVG
jgi:agmatinase